MSLPHIILSQLKHYSELTGYDITVKFKGNDGICWIASHQQVYRELAKLEDKGLVTHFVSPQEGKPDRKVFQITSKGSKELDVWTGKEVPESGFRDQLAAKVQASRNTDHKAVMIVLAEEIKSVSKEIEDIGGMIATDVIDELLISRRVSHLKWRKQWAEQTLEVLYAASVAA